MKKLKETKIGAFIFRNFSLKLLALVIAFFVWILVTNIAAPYTSKTFNSIAVELRNIEYLQSRGYTYDIKDKDKINIRVKAPKATMDELNVSNFVAYVDLSEIRSDDTCPIHVETPNEKVEIVSADQYMKLSIDNKISKDFVIQVDEEGLGDPAAGYIVSEATVSPNSITITGAESLIRQIDHVGIKYDVSNMNKSVVDSVKPICYKADGTELDISKLSLNREKVSLYVTIQPTKWINVNYSLYGELPEDYEIVSNTANITTVKITGTKEALAKIDSIDIPSGGIDVTGITSDTQLSVALATYLTADYAIISPIKTLTVDVTVRHMIYRDFEIPFSSISIIGLSNNLAAKLSDGAKLPTINDELETDAEETEAPTDHRDNAIIVTVYGEENAVKALTIHDLAPTVSATARNEGTYSVKISMNTNENYTIKDTYYITLTLVDTTPVETPTQEPTQEDDPAEPTTPESQEEPTQESISPLNEL